MKEELLLDGSGAEGGAVRVMSRAMGERWRRQIDWSSGFGCGGVNVGVGVLRRVNWSRWLAGLLVLLV